MTRRADAIENNAMGFRIISWALEVAFMMCTISSAAKNARSSLWSINIFDALRVWSLWMAD